MEARGSREQMGPTGVTETGWRVAQLVAWAFVSIPLAVTEVLPLVDYPSHLVRIHLLARWADLPGYARFYLPAWDVLPNLSLELIAVPVAALIGPAHAVRVFCALAFGLIIHGVARLSRIAGGTRTYWCIAPALLLYNYVFAFGFLNFVFGVGVALVLLAWHIEGRERATRARVLPEVLAVALLFFCHLVPLVLYLLGAAAYDLASAARRSRRPGQLLDDMAPLAAGAGVAVALLAISPFSTHGGWVFEPFGAKFWKAGRLLMTGQGDWDKAFAIALAITFVALLASRQIRFDRRLAAAAMVWVLAFLLAPAALSSTSLVDARLPLPLALMAFAGVDASRARPGPLLVVLASLLLFRVGVTTVHYARWSEDLTEVRRDLDAVPSGSIVFSAYPWDGSVWQTSAWRPPLIHAHELAVLDRPMYVPSLLTHLGQRPMRPSPAFDVLDNPAGVDPARLSSGELARRLTASLRDGGLREPAYLFAVGTVPVPGGVSGLDVVLTRTRYTLYRLVSGPATPPGGGASERRDPPPGP